MPSTLKNPHRDTNHANKLITKCIQILWLVIRRTIFVFCKFVKLLKSYQYSVTPTRRFDADYEIFQSCLQRIIS